MNDIVNICMITDDNYVIPTVVAITSAIKNKCENVGYNFFIINTNISEYNKNKIKRLDNSETGVSINFINADINKYENLIAHSHVPITALLKFDLPNLLNLNKVLYLDGDILVTKCLNNLFKLNIDNYYLAAVSDMGGCITQKFNERIGVDNYFNSGVLLLNLEKIRNENIFSVLVKTKNEHPQWPCMDQDVMNYVLGSNVLWVDLKYNCMLPLYRHMEYSLESINKFYNTNYSNQFEMEDDSVILHFAGESERRPWENFNGTYSDLWNFYYKLSPYSNISIESVYNFYQSKKIKVDTKSEDKFLEKIFSIKNKNKHKVITILGIKIKLAKGEK